VIFWSFVFSPLCPATVPPYFLYSLKKCIVALNFTIWVWSIIFCCFDFITMLGITQSMVLSKFKCNVLYYFRFHKYWSICYLPNPTTFVIWL
jgi:hypothetical protein